MPIKYTDIDYLVFSDASHFVYNGKSPYLRETYRYTPLLSMILVPNNWGPIWYNFGKVLFMICDIVTGYIIMKLLREKSGLSENKVLMYSSIWLLNPMVITISTRGSSESLLTVMIMLSLYFLQSNQLYLSAFWLGLSIHFKIYPIIYLPSILLTIRSSPIVNLPVLKLLNWKNLRYMIVTMVTFLGINYVMYLKYGFEFINETYLYHLVRLDHRHNFSIYNMALYYKSTIETREMFDIERIAFIPQLVLSGIIIPLWLAEKDLMSTLFIQTFIFVTFNKVMTSQYFIWFLIFLPHFLSRSRLTTTNKVQGMIILLLWIISQGSWLYYAYKLEFLGENTFDYQLFYSSIGFFLSNCVCINRFISTI